MTTMARHPGGAPRLCLMQTELAACLRSRAEAGVTQLTFSKCHKEGEMHSCNLGASVKTVEDRGSSFIK